MIVEYLDRKLISEINIFHKYLPILAMTRKNKQLNLANIS